MVSLAWVAVNQSRCGAGRAVGRLLSGMAAKEDYAKG